MSDAPNETRWLCLPEDGIEREGTIYGHAAEPFDPNEDTDSDDPNHICVPYVRADILDALEAERDRLREALKPFGHCLERMTLGPNDLIAIVEDDTGKRLNVLHSECFLRARATLSPDQKDKT